MTVTDADLRYPIGRFSPVQTDAPVRRRLIADIAALPARLSEAAAGLDARQVDTSYRPGGWSVRQLVHHIADSHINAFVRLKLALTEDQPRISAYDEKAFATLADSRLPISVSLDLVRTLHGRWVAVYDAMSDADFGRVFIHPEYPEPLTLDWQVQMYAWHSRHHVAHITGLRQRERW
jgi:hypothetical protein